MMSQSQGVDAETETGVEVEIGRQSETQEKECHLTRRPLEFVLTCKLNSQLHDACSRRRRVKDRRCCIDVVELSRFWLVMWVDGYWMTGQSEVLLSLS